MKKVALLLLALLSALVFAQDYEAVDPSGQEVVFWHNHPRAREEALIEIVNAFNETNPYGITVTAEFQSSDYGEIFQKMLPLLGSSETPNLVVAYQNQAATYQLAEGLIDLNPLVNSATWGLSDEEKSDFFTGFFNADIFPSFENKRLGFPPNRSMEVMYYNSEWLAELGYDAPPSTPEEFKEVACKAAAQPFSRATSEGSVGYEFAGGASNVASWTFAFGGDIFDYEANAYTYDSDAAVSAMSFLQDLFNEGCATLVTEAYGDQTNFGAGRTLFTVGSTSGIPFYQSAIDEGAMFEWSVAPLPHTTEDPVMNIYGASVSLPAGHTPEENVATWLFVKYYTSPEVQAKWAEASNYFPVRQGAANELGDYFEANPTYAQAFDLLQYGVSEPPVPGYDFVRDMIEQEVVLIVDGGADVASTLDAANQEANLILDDQMSDMQ